MKKASEIITALFKEKFGIDFMETGRASANLFSSWHRILAEAWNVSADSEITASSHSKVRELESGLLTIEADHPGWIQIFQTKQTELLTAAQHQYPELGIKAITFRLQKGN